MANNTAVFTPDAQERLLAARPGFEAATPFSFLQLDGLFDPAFLRTVAASYYPSPDPRWHRFSDESREVKLQLDDAAQFPAPVKALVDALMSADFLRTLSAATGIPGLIPDPYFYGGGMHQIMTGGKLAIHADYNLHPVMKLERRLNVLVYLNEDWDEAWGGHLELWDTDMKACAHAIAPLFNRLALFRTDSTSYHGHPNPLACPPARSRRSVALYYYTQSRGEGPAQGGHSTLFRERPGEVFADPPIGERARQARVHAIEAIRALTPGSLKRIAKKIRGR